MYFMYVSMCVLINLLHQSLIKVAIFLDTYTRAIYNLACILKRIGFLTSSSLKIYFFFFRIAFSRSEEDFCGNARENVKNALRWNRTYITILFQLALSKVKRFVIDVHA